MDCDGCSSNVVEKEVQKKEHESIKVTDFAAKKINEMKDKSKEGLRIGLSAGGCAGFSYVMEFDNSKENDIVIEDNGIKMLIDKESMSKLEGTTVDYVESLQQSGFKLDNPNSNATCGCGKSSSF